MIVTGVAPGLPSSGQAVTGLSPGLPICYHDPSPPLLSVADDEEWDITGLADFFGDTGVG